MTSLPKLKHNLVPCPNGCGYGMRPTSSECYACRYVKHRAVRHIETMARRQEKYGWKIDVLRDQLEMAHEPMPAIWVAAGFPGPDAAWFARKQAEIERWEHYCGLRP